MARVRRAVRLLPQVRLRVAVEVLDKKKETIHVPAVWGAVFGNVRSS